MTRSGRADIRFPADLHPVGYPSGYGFGGAGGAGGSGSDIATVMKSGETPAISARKLLPRRTHEQIHLHECPPPAHGRLRRSPGPPGLEDSSIRPETEAILTHLPHRRRLCHT